MSPLAGGNLVTNKNGFLGIVFFFINVSIEEEINKITKLFLYGFEV